VEEGRLAERACPDCGGVERRAFGEFESTRGELASYAFGWTSDHADEPIGYMTIGLGAGNPGGGSFHCELRPDEESFGYVLVDQPFEDVPEGGPDLTREEALAHECIDFVWYVADEVMERDRRGRWMEHYLVGTRAFATAPVAERTAPVRHVVRDHDGDWQLLCGTIEPDEPHLLHLYHVVDEDSSLLDVLDLEPGERADRDQPGSRWVKSVVEENGEEP
jgi:hypothetical protein